MRGIYFGFLLALFCRTALADCSKLRTYDSAVKSSAPKLLVLPFQGDASMSPIVTVLLREYLALGKDLRLGASPILSGKVSKAGGSEYLVQATLQSTGTKKERAGEIGRWEGSFRLGGETSTINDMMIGLVMKITEALHEPLSEKKILPFLNTTSSPDSYRAYADGIFILDGGDPLTEVSLTRAIQSFERSIQADYNYVPGYRGLAEALAAQAALTSNAAMAQKARVALAKAKLLNPYVTKMREDRIDWYLQADRKELCPD